MGKKLEPQVPLELGIVVTNKVQNEKSIFAILNGRLAQASTKLLEKYEGAVSRPQHENCVDSWNVDTFVEQIGCENEVQARRNRTQVVHGLVSFLRRRRACQNG